MFVSNFVPRVSQLEPYLFSSSLSSQGNSVLHLLILQKDHRASLDMFKYLIDELEVGAGLEDLTNKEGLTPLKLAAKEANVEVRDVYAVSQKRSLCLFCSNHW